MIERRIVKTTRDGLALIDTSIIPSTPFLAFVVDEKTVLVHARPGGELVKLLLLVLQMYDLASCYERCVGDQATMTPPPK